MANQQTKQTTLKTTKGTIENCPCPFCGFALNFADMEEGMPGQQLLSLKDTITCDKCKNVSMVVGYQEITVIHLRQYKLHPEQAQRAQAQQQQPQRPTVGGFLGKLLGKG